MTRPQDCRKRIVQAALKLFASGGYYHTSIADILRESGCKRGSLYHYFSSKEELGYAAIDESIRLLVEQGAHSHIRSKEHPIDRLLAVLDDLPSTLKLESGHSIKTGIAAGMASVHEGFRQHVGRKLGAMVQQLEGLVRTGVADGQIVDSIDPDQVAHMVVIVGHGMQMATLLGHREVIWEDTRRWLKDYLNSLRK